jgi:peptide-methionine (S)-S-oxide reductase
MRTKFFVVLTTASVAVLVVSILGCSPQTHRSEESSVMSVQTDNTSGKLEKATFGAGCFWCTEALFQQLNGVQSVVSGYSGGHVENPTYAQVCSGSSGHAEVIQLTYDPERISYEELLEVFWLTHDPTTPNRQGPDVGPQYRSVIFFHSDAQRQLAEHYKQKLDEASAFRAPIVTEISPMQEFYPAENYHQDYYEQNQREPYCSDVIRPKLEKFKKVFREKVKAERTPMEKASRTDAEWLTRTC